MFPNTVRLFHEHVQKASPEINGRQKVLANDRPLDLEEVETSGLGQFTNNFLNENSLSMDLNLLLRTSYKSESELNLDGSYPLVGYLAWWARRIKCANEANPPPMRLMQNPDGSVAGARWGQQPSAGDSDRDQ